MKVSVVGCGYLGAVHAAAMTRLGHEVVAVDVDEHRIAVLQSGVAPFFEPGLNELLSESLQTGRLTFGTDIAAVSDAELHFIAVGTPQAEVGGAADLTYVNGAVSALLPHLREGALVVGKSTVPVGTAAELASTLAQNAPHATLAWNPEFLREGFAVQDTLRPDRLVYGTEGGAAGERATRLLDEVYADVLAHGTPRITTDFATAELVKVAANAFLATKISFINAMAEISEQVGADVTQLADALGYDERIGRKFLGAGVGFGGGCLPKDIRAFTARAEELGLGPSVAFLREVDAINLRRRDRVIELAWNALGGSVEERRITVLGASFKPNSDDVRDSPALDIASRLHALGALVTVTDPQGIRNASAKQPELYFVADTTEALKESELVLLLTEWQEYRDLDPVATRALAKSANGVATIIDGRNCLDREAWRHAGWVHVGLGR